MLTILEKLWNFFTENATAFSAISTFFASGLALYFGVFGNWQAKIQRKINQDNLNRKAYEFLVEIILLKSRDHGILVQGGTREELFDNAFSGFRDAVVLCSIIRKKSLRRYNRYLKLAREYFLYLKAPNENKYTDIRNELNFLIGTVSDEVRRKKDKLLNDYESKHFWKQGLVKITHRKEVCPYRSVIVYTAIKGDSGEYIINEKLNELRDFFKKANNISGAVDLQIDRDLDWSLQEPSDYGELIKREPNPQYLIFRRDNKEIKLEINQPRLI